MQSAYPIIIYGAGGHGQVIAESLTLLNHDLIHYWDQVQVDMVGGKSVFQPLDGPRGFLVLGMGNISVRKSILTSLPKEVMFFPHPIIHPSAFVAPSAQVGEGSWVGPLALVHTHAKIGNHVIINSGAKVDHDVVIGHNVHIAPGATLCGGVTIGDHSFIGANAVIPPGISIGADAFIKAGTVVTNDIPNGGVR